MSDEPESFKQKKVDATGILSSVPMFLRFSEKDLIELSKIVSYKKFKKGDVIFSEGENGEFFCFVINGSVKLTKGSAEGREIIIKTLSQGMPFAEVNILVNIPYPATATAADDCEIGMLYNSYLEHFLLTNNEFALRLIKLLSERLFETNKKLASYTMGNVRERLLDFFKNYGKENGQTEFGVVEFTPNMTKQELASIIGTTRETLSRTLSKLKAEGVVEVVGKVIKLHLKLLE